MLDDMPKIARELSALEVKSLSGHGWHAVGGVAGLLLQVKCEPDTGKVLSRSLILRKRIGGKRQPIGLGSYPQTSLADARNKARTLSLDAQNGVDLLAKKREQRSAAIAAEARKKNISGMRRSIYGGTRIRLQQLQTPRPVGVNTQGIRVSKDRPNACRRHRHATRLRRTPTTHQAPKWHRR